MSKKEDEKSVKKTKAHDYENVTFEAGYTNEQPVQNAEVVQASQLEINPTKSTIMSRYSIADEIEKVESEEVPVSYTYKNGYEFINRFSLSSLRKRHENGESITSINNDMKSFIKDNYETNPELVQLALMHLFGDSEKQHYDHGTGNILGISGFTRKTQGEDSEQVLEKVLSNPDNTEIEGFVCSTMHEWGKFILDELKIPATLIAGGTDTSNHTTLLWQRADGKYVHTNYGKSQVLNASNMKDAVKEIYKKGMGLINNGYMYIIDGNGSHNENIMGEVVAIGENELDKRDYNKESLFNNNVASKSSINGKANISSLGSVSAEASITTAYSNLDNTINKERNIKIGYKTTKNSSIADESESVGAEYELKKEKILPNGKTYKSTKLIANVTNLTNNASDISYNSIQPAESIKFTNPEDLEKLQNFYGTQYENDISIDDYKQKYEKDLRRLDYLQNYYLQNFTQMEAPISKEDFVYDYLQKYVNENQTFEDVLNDQTLLLWGERAWSQYIIDHLYIGAEEFLINRIADTKDHIENYEKYKQEYIDTRIQKHYALIQDSKESFVDFKTTHLTTFIRQVFGKEKTVLNDKNIELKDGYQISGLIGFNKVFGSESFGGDARICAEAGTELNIKGKHSLFSTNLSAGATADLSLKTGCLTPTVSPGLKLNAGASYKTRINDNVTFGTAANGYTVMTGLTTGTGSHDWGAEAQLQTNIRPNGSNMTIFGMAKAGFEKQQIKSGGFEELTENMTKLGFSVGTIFKSGNSLQFNFQKQTNHLNPTYNRETYSVSANIKI